MSKKATSPVTVAQDTTALSAEQVYRSVLSSYPDVLDVEQVCEILSISTKTAYKLLNDGALNSLKVGRAFKIPKLYMLQYIKLINACGHI